ncbi:PAS domain S-box-containing protein [Halohasta litchfieldiae]|uniref:histidine kinase n=1 Tax=Halohasta litchfieldiae TaxID=1073996 RepID=A0A1H6RSK7_9EURY|nr:PAS domain-containing sensor histidine kinase [Halohasta litchfieldiae]ATW89284.1 PAS domain S-box-containing protein [Halohasta litchfieldiae]SEI58731.1 PAS domain S-box-containing protein [Halohasta litchfieldiae]
MNTNDTQSSDRFQQLFEQLNDAVVEFALVDDEPIVRDVNCTFVTIFGYDAEEAIGEPLNELIVPSSEQAEAENFDQRTADGESNAAVVRRATVDGNRTFVYRGVAYAEDCGFAIYSDITEEMQRERYLDVLQRVVRHNLRNDLNIVLGVADTILERTDDSQITAAATTIKQTAEGLARLSEEAKIVDSVLGEQTTVEPTPLRPIVKTVLTEYQQQFETATISVNLPADLSVAADKRLYTLLRSLVDNALVHNDAPTPKVNIRVTTAASEVQLEVLDNGPGIPDAEQAIVLGAAEITPLNHGSGLGLWLVKWITDSYGAEVEIETSDSGSLVRVRLDRTDSPPS